MRKVSILIPSSLTVESKDEKLKAYKVGMIARACAIFRVDEVLVYKDNEYDDSRFIVSLLKYAETPQYLRKRIFPLMDELKYAGVIPPLRTPHHPLHSSSSMLKKGELRDGFVVGGKADIGVEKLADIEGEAKEGERMTFEVISVEPLKVTPSEPKDYWGYKTKSCGTLGRVLKRIRDQKIIFTSKYGKVVQNLNFESVAFVFGSPTRGVREILADEGLRTEDFSDLVINTIPNQGTETVRVEEAIFSTLAVYNIQKW